MNGCEVAGCGLVPALALSVQPATAWFGEAVQSVSERAAWFFPLVAGVAGAAAASLSGLAVHRLPRMMGWHGEPEHGLSLSHPHSHCDSCGARVPPLALIPVMGWYLAEGRCRDCGSRVPWVYPASEALLGASSMVLVAVLGPTLTALSLLVLTWLLAFVSWLDWAEHEIPDIVTVPVLFMGLLWSPFEADTQARVLGAAVSGLLMWGTFRITASVKDVEAMSIGDVALCGALGGWLGICAVPPYLLACCACYLAYAVPLRSRGVTWTPMAPGISAGFALAAATGFRLF